MPTDYSDDEPDTENSCLNCGNHCENTFCNVECMDEYYAPDCKGQ